VVTEARVARVLIADDQTLFRRGLARLLEEDPRIALVGQAADGHDAVKKAAALRPDVVLMDLRMPGMDGAEATQQIIREHPEVHQRSEERREGKSAAIGAGCMI